MESNQLLKFFFSSLFDCIFYYIDNLLQIMSSLFSILVMRNFSFIMSDVLPWTLSALLSDSVLKGVNVGKCVRVYINQMHNYK